LLGSIKIPRINISENLFMGTGGQMRHGAGHLAGTPMPGERGNVVIAAHRVMSGGKQPFRHLDLLRNGDAVAVKFGDETFTYEVFDSFIVNERDLWVLYPLGGETHMLTLVTCDPVVSVGRRENRLIVRARLAE
jgi:sortase A